MQIRAQGATEYLVLLAVVLIVALVSVALLGFFPGMASDAQITQSQTYWRSATPIAIPEALARVASFNTATIPYLRVKNNGMYPIRLTALVDPQGTGVYQFNGGNCGVPAVANVSDYYYMAPGEEKVFGFSWYGGITCSNWFMSQTGASVSAFGYLGRASSVCQNSTDAPGTLYYKTLGFEYIVYMEGQQVTKRQISSEPLIVKCLQPYQGG